MKRARRQGCPRPHLPVVNAHLPRRLHAAADTAAFFQHALDPTRQAGQLHHAGPRMIMSMGNKSSEPRNDTGERQKIDATQRDRAGLGAQYLVQHTQDFQLH